MGLAARDLCRGPSLCMSGSGVNGFGQNKRVGGEMAKRKPVSETDFEITTEPEVVVEAAVVVPVRFYILVEGVDGGEPTRLAVDEDATGERLVTVGGQRYEHCADGPEGRWVYRAMAF